MNNVIIFFSTLFMNISLPLLGQENVSVSIEWSIAGNIEGNSSIKSLGISGAVSGIYKNTLIVAGGNNFPDGMPWNGGKKKYYNDVTIYSKSNGQIASISIPFKLSSNISYAATCSTPLGVFYGGGENENGITNQAYLLKLDENNKNLQIQQLPSLPLSVTNASAANIGNTIYVAGGETSSGVSNQIFSIDLNSINPTWIELPSVPKSFSHAVMVAQISNLNNCIYIIGGRTKLQDGISIFYSSVLAYDIKAKQWLEKKSLPHGLSAGTGVAYKDHYIIMIGGDKGDTFHQTELLINAIAAEKDPIKKQMLVEQKASLQSNHPGFSKDQLLYNTKTDEWSNLAEFPFTSPVTTSAMILGNSIVIPGGEIKAGVRNASILLGKIKP
jgi:N-acetylneuraminic acid mutarotase